MVCFVRLSCAARDFFHLKIHFYVILRNKNFRDVDEADRALERGLRLWRLAAPRLKSASYF
jgi:hypothetical protein